MSIDVSRPRGGLRISPEVSPVNERTHLDHNQPMVYALMVTGKPGRGPLAAAAINSFARQTWHNKLLIIVNDGEDHLDISGVPAVAVHVPPGQTLGALRNIALNAVPDGELWIQWDDDDWHHPAAITSMVRALGRHAAVVLRRQVQYSFRRDAAWVYERKKGFEGTILARKLPGDASGGGVYPEHTHGEDTVFRDRLQRWPPFRDAGGLRVWSNPAHLYLRFIHGRNTWDDDHFRLDQRERGQWLLDRDAAEYLATVLHDNPAYFMLRADADNAPTAEAS